MMALQPDTPTDDQRLETCRSAGERGLTEAAETLSDTLSNTRAAAGDQSNLSFEELGLECLHGLDRSSR